MCDIHLFMEEVLIFFLNLGRQDFRDETLVTFR